MRLLLCLSSVGLTLLLCISLQYNQWHRLPDVTGQTVYHALAELPQLTNELLAYASTLPPVGCHWPSSIDQWLPSISTVLNSPGHAHVPSQLWLMHELGQHAESTVDDARAAVQHTVNTLLEPWTTAYATHHQFNLPLQRYLPHVNNRTATPLITTAHIDALQRDIYSHRVARFRWSKYKQSANNTVQWYYEDSKPAVEYVANPCVGTFQHNMGRQLNYRVKDTYKMLQLYVELTPVAEIPDYMDIVISYEVYPQLERRRLSSNVHEPLPGLITDEHTYSSLPTPLFSVWVSSQHLDIPWPHMQLDTPMRRLKSHTSRSDLPPDALTLDDTFLSLNATRNSDCSLSAMQYQYIHQLLTVYSRLLVKPWSTNQVGKLRLNTGYAPACDLNTCHTVCCCHHCIKDVKQKYLHKRNQLNVLPADNQLAFPSPLQDYTTDNMYSASSTTITATDVALLDRRLDVFAHQSVTHWQQWDWHGFNVSSNTLIGNDNCTAAVNGTNIQSECLTETVIDEYHQHHLTSAPPPLPMRNLTDRIAILYTGNVRSFASTFPFTKLHVIDTAPYPVDLFFHIWEDADTWTFEPTLQAMNVSHLIKAVLIEQQPVAPKVMAEAQSCRIDETQTPTVFTIQAESLRRVHRLKRIAEYQMEAKYRWVIRTRFDQQIRRDFWPDLLAVSDALQGVQQQHLAKVQLPAMARLPPVEDAYDWSYNPSLSVVPPEAINEIYYPSCNTFKEGYNDQFAVGSSDAMHAYAEKPEYFHRCIGYGQWWGFQAENCFRKIAEHSQASYRLRVMWLPICYTIVRPQGFVNTWGGGKGDRLNDCTYVTYYGVGCCNDVCFQPLADATQPQCYPLTVDDASSDAEVCLPAESVEKCHARRQRTRACWPVR